MQNFPTKAVNIGNVYKMPFYKHGHSDSTNMATQIQIPSSKNDSYIWIKISQNSAGNDAW